MALLTDAYVRKLKLKPGKREFDDKLEGYGVRGREDGRLSWIIQKKLRGANITKAIGDTALMRERDARAKAMTLLAAIARGEDPRTEALRAPGTLRELCKAYVRAVEPKLGPRTMVEHWRYLLGSGARKNQDKGKGYWVPLHRLQLIELERNRRLITQRAREIAHEYGNIAGNRAFGSLSGALSWGVKEGWLDSNPAIGANAPFEGEKRRDIVLSPAGIAAIWRAAGDEVLGDFGTITRLLTALPLRRTEIGGLRRREVDLDARLIRLPPERCKNKSEHVVPLNEAAVQILRDIPATDVDTLFGGERGGIGFTSWAGGKRRLDELLAAAGTPIDFTLHDLRRTIATRLGDLGTPPHVIECLLAHVGGFRSGVSGTYNHSRYWDDMVAAMDRWAGYVAACLTGTVDRYVASLRPPQPPPAPVTELHSYR
jgi:integrase